MNHDISKLPKWAQERIQKAESRQNLSEYGAYVNDVHIENNVIKHTRSTGKTIQAIASALAENAKTINAAATAAAGNADALEALAKTLQPPKVDAEFGPGIHLTDIRHR